MAVLNQTPFRSADIDTGYNPDSTATLDTSLMASPLRFAALDLPRETHPIIGMYFNGPVESIQQRVVLQAVQNPGLIPSSTL